MFFFKKKSDIICKEKELLPKSAKYQKKSQVT